LRRYRAKPARSSETYFRPPPKPSHSNANDFRLPPKQQNKDENNFRPWPKPPRSSADDFRPPPTDKLHFTQYSPISFVKIFSFVTNLSYKKKVVFIKIKAKNPATPVAPFVRSLPPTRYIMPIPAVAFIVP